MKYLENFDSEIFNITNIVNIAKDEGLNVSVTDTTDGMYRHLHSAIIALGGDKERSAVNYDYVVNISNHNDSPVEIMPFYDHIKIVEDIINRLQQQYEVLFSIMLFPDQCSFNNQQKYLSPETLYSDQYNLSDLEGFLKGHRQFTFRDMKDNKIIQHTYKFNGVNILIR